MFSPVVARGRCRLLEASHGLQASLRHHRLDLHDLRRTARSLMARAGVSSEHAERVLGHALPGIEGVYNLHGYMDEKADALKRLAALIETIVHGEPGKNVVPLRAPAMQP